MLKRTFSLAFAALLLFSLSLHVRVGYAFSSDEEYEVYSAWLVAKWSANSKQQVVILNTTLSVGAGGLCPKRRSYLLTKLPSLSEETLDDYVASNQSSNELSDRFKIKAKVVLISPDDIKGIFRLHDVRKNWEAFYKKYANTGGYVELSKVGLDSKRAQALVYASYHCGDLCAYGAYYLLVKEEGEWKVKNQLMVWAS